MTETLTAWVEAGGDLRRFEVLARAGRVAPIVLPGGSVGDGRALAGIHPDRPTVGTIGDWVGGVEVLRAAEAWLASQGCVAAEGPALLAPWFPYRATLGPYDQPPLAQEPTERGDRWIAAGYAPVARYVSIVSGHDVQIKAGVDRAAALGSRGWKLASIETGPSSSISVEAYDGVIRTIHDLATRAYADVPGYLAVPADVIADWYRPIVSQLDPRLALIAYDPSGRPAAYVLGAPDPAQPDRKWFQILSLGVAPEHRSSGVATWMVAAAHQAARRAGYVAGVHVLVRVDGTGLEDTTWLRGDVIRRYALFRRTW
ncbi:MAG: GNAT family N-acetyltransferase [Myxococcota bacterium]